MSSGAAADPASTDASFAQHYKIRDEVGRGAFGAVFFATRSAVDESATASAATVREEQSDSGEVVAVKRFELAELTSSERSDAIAEAALLRSLSHENIIEYIDLFVGVSRIHLVTSYVGGGTVFDQLSHADGNDTGAPIKPYSEAEACGALRRVLDALCYLHDGSSGNYVLYRDLKPENLLLAPARTADGLADRTRVVLCDFGFAIRLRASVPGVGGKAVRELATEACYTPGICVAMKRREAWGASATRAQHPQQHTRAPTVPTQRQHTAPVSAHNMPATFTYAPFRLVRPVRVWCP